MITPREVAGTACPAVREGGRPTGGRCGGAEGIAFWRADARLTGANQAFGDLLGYTPKEIGAGRVGWPDLGKPVSLKELLTVIAELAAPSGPGPPALPIRYSTGSVACASARRSVPRCRAIWLAPR